MQILRGKGNREEKPNAKKNIRNESLALKIPKGDSSEDLRIFQEVLVVC